MTPEYRVYLFRQIHEIVFHGGGGYDYDTVYHMPIWLRKFTFKTLQEHFDKQNEQTQQTIPTEKKNNVVKVPNYTTKARK
jgi:hypothetical protein